VTTHPTLTTGTDTWATPPHLFAELDAEFGFGLDAAAQPATAKCPDYYALEHADPTRRDALKRDWHADAAGQAVWCNPPYARPHQAAFIRKAAETAAAGTTVVLLIPARTDTAVWHEVIFPKAEVRFLRGRVRFWLDGKPGGPATFPSAVVVFRP
jgi:site-specific DNA-methyltransferase (adenine-specific)